MSTLRNIYKVTKAQYEALENGETVTINGVDYSYDSTALYLVEDSGSSLYRHLISLSHGTAENYSVVHTVECFSRDSTPATDAYSANAYIGSTAGTLTRASTSNGTDVLCLNGSISWQGGYHRIRFGIVKNGVIEDMTMSLFGATYTDTVTEV